MAFPTVPVALAAVAGTAFVFRKKISEFFRLFRPVGEGPIKGSVDKLTKGTTYAVLVQLGGAATPGAGGHFTEVSAASRFLSDFFNGHGFTVLDAPALRDEEARSKFAAALPSTWLFKAKRTAAEPFVSEGHPMIGQALFTPLPTS